MAINSRLTLNNTQFIAALEQSSGAIGRMVGQASTQMQAMYAQTDALNSRLQRGIGRFADELTNMGRNLTLGVSVPLLGLAGASLAAYGQIDSLKRGLFSIEKTAEGTEARFNSLKEVAALPGLGLEEAIKGDIRLRAVGISADLSKKSLLEFGNAIALTGGGKTDLDRVTVQLAQMSAKSKVLAQDLKPIIEAAPSVSQALQKMFGTVDSEEISKKLQARGLNSTDFIGILVKEMEKLPRVSGGIKNAMENMGDLLKVAGYEFGQILDKTLGLSEKLNYLGEAVGRAVSYFKNLSPEAQKLIIGLAGIAVAAGPVLVAIGYLTSGATYLAAGVGTVGVAFSKLSGFLLANPYVIIAGAVIALGVALYSLAKANDKVNESQKSIDSVMGQAQASIVTEGAKVSALIEITRSEIRSKGEKMVALNKLIEISPKYFGKLTLETIQTGKAEEATKKYTDALLNNAIAKGAEAKISELGLQLINEKDAFDKATKAAVEYKKLVSESKPQNIGMGVFVKPIFSNEFDNRVKDAKTKIAEIETAIKNLAKYTIADQIDTKGGATASPNFTGGGNGAGKELKRKTVADPGKYFRDMYEDFAKDLQVFKNKINAEMHGIKINPAELTIKGAFNLDMSGIQRIKDILGANSDLFPTTMLAKNFNEYNDILTTQAVKLFGNTAMTLQESKEKIAGLWSGIGDAAKTAQDSILIGFASNIGAFLGGGQTLSGAISNIASSVLGALGDFAISIGTKIVAMAPLFAAVRVFLENAMTNPAALGLGLGAGLALIALGVGMKALGSSLSATSQSFTSGGSVGGGGGGGGGTFNNPFTQGGMGTFQPIEVLIKGETVTRGSDLVTTYTNEKSFTQKVRRR